MMVHEWFIRDPQRIGFAGALADDGQASDVVHDRVLRE